MESKLTRGNVYWVNLDPTQGAEIKKVRPGVLVGASPLNQARRTVLVVPLSRGGEARPPITVKVQCHGPRGASGLRPNQGHRQNPSICVDRGDGHRRLGKYQQGPKASSVPPVSRFKPYSPPLSSSAVNSGSVSRASRAASCSACFLVRPWPRARGRSPRQHLHLEDPGVAGAAFGQQVVGGRVLEAGLGQLLQPGFEVLPGRLGQLVQAAA